MSADTVSPTTDSADNRSRSGDRGFDAPSNGVVSEPPIEPVTVDDGPEAGIDLGLVLAGVSAGISVQDATGRIIYANQVAARMAGFASATEMMAASGDQIARQFDLLDESGEPLDRATLPGRRVFLGDVPEPMLVGFRLQDGVERWSLLHATAGMTPEGQMVAINTFHDVTPRVEAERRIRDRERRFREMAEQRRRAEDRLDSVLREMPVGVILVDAATGQLLFANDAARRLPHIRFRIGETLKYLGNEGWRLDGTRLGPEDWPLRRAMRGETTRNEVLTIDGPGGRRSYNLSAGPMRDRSGGVDLVIETVTDITERVAAQEQERFLARASEVLASSLDYEQTVQTVADLAVPQFAEWCVVQLADEEGVPRRIAVAHRDPDKVAFAELVSAEYPPDRDAATGPAAILRTGVSEYVPDISAELMDAAARDDRHRDMLRELSIRSYISVPLTAAGRILGVLTLVNGESAPRFEPSDVTFAENLAARAAAAIENARLFREGVRFKRLLDATSDAVLMLDTDGTVVYANQSAAQHVGRDAADLVGAPIEIHLDDTDATALAAGIQALAAGEADARTLTVRLNGVAGEQVPVEIRLQLVALVAEPRRILAVARDRREQIAAESALRTLAVAEHARAAELNAVIRAMGEGVVVCDRDGRIILANPAAEDVFPDVEETTYAEILAELEDPDGEAPKLGPNGGGPVELRVKRGDERWIEVSTWPVSHDKGEDLRDETIVVLRDVTEARQRQAVRDTFIGVLSHELRTPVTTIYAGAKVLGRPASELPANTRAEIFNDIVVESERLHRLVEDVVAMTRFGEEGGDVGAEPVLLQRLLPSVIASEEGRWPGVAFDLAIPGGLPTVIADPTYVEQVVRNLLSNAAKYGGAGATVGVAVESSATEVLIRILDDGPGFPPEETDRLFELFFRSARTSRSASGAGIGLFVCARLIRAMGGRIWAANRPEGGAEFGFSLRVMDEDP